jgi:hypothetical protein
MGHGEKRASRTARQALDALYNTLLTYGSSEHDDTALKSEILHQLDVMTQARRARLVAAEGIVPGVVWLVLFGGAVVTLVFTFFFGTLNLRAQTMMTVLLSILIFSELLIVIAIDRPFTGSVKVEPTAIADVVADFGTEPGGDRLPAVQPQR